MNVRPLVKKEIFHSSIDLDKKNVHKNKISGNVGGGQ